jgi:hypothetical protein
MFLRIIGDGLNIWSKRHMQHFRHLTDGLGTIIKYNRAQCKIYCGGLWVAAMRSPNFGLP